MKFQNPFYPLAILLCFLGPGCGIFFFSNDEPFATKEAERYYSLAYDFQLEGNLDTSLICFNIADKLSPDHPQILHARGLLIAKLHGGKAALKDLNRSIELTSDERKKQIRICNRALIHMDMGNMEAACRDWKNAGKYGKHYVEEYCE